MNQTGTNGNIILATRNWIDVPDTIMGGAPFSTALPLGNIRQNRLSLVARTEGSQSLYPWMLIDTGADINPVSLVAFPRHGLSDGATWRIRGLVAKSSSRSNDTLRPIVGRMSINLERPATFGTQWFVVIRQIDRPNSNWMMGQIVPGGSGTSFEFDCASFAALSDIVSGPWSVFILSPDDKTGAVRYDSRPILGRVKSDSSVTIGEGDFRLHVNENRFFFPGSNVIITRQSDPAHWILCTVRAYDWMKGQLDVRAKTSSGTSATFNDVLVSRASDDIHVWPSVMAFGQALWGNDYGWGGRLQRGENYSPPAIHYIPLVAGRAMPVYARFWLIEMADPSNKAGFLDFSKLILSPAFQPAVNLSFNWQIEWVDPSPTSRARGGQVYTDPRRRYRRLSFSFENQQTLEAFSHLYELDRVQGKTSPILAVVAPSDAANLHRTSIYGSMPELPGLRNTFVDRYAKDIVIEEWL